LAKKVGKAKVVPAFSTSPSEALFDVFRRKKRTPRRPFSLALAHVAYEGEDGPRIGYRIERFGT
jgi:hypothetical protein